MSSAVEAMEFYPSDDSDVASSNSNDFPPIRLKKSATLPKRKASMNPKLRVQLHDTGKSSSLPRSSFLVQERVKFTLTEKSEELSQSEDESEVVSYSFLQ